MTAPTFFRLCTAVFIPLFAAKLSAQDTIQFRRDVRPILSDTCFKCHGPDEKARQGELRLDRRADAASVLNTDQDVSEIIRRITSPDPDERMPPPATKLALTPAQIQTLKKWVKQGAKYEKHWSFEPIAMPVISAVSAAPGRS